MIDRIISKIGGGLFGLGAFALIVVMMIIFVNVVARLFELPIPGVFDIVTAVVTVAISFSIAYACINKAHIVVDIIKSRLPKLIGYIFQIINDVLGISILGIIAYQAFKYAHHMLMLNERTTSVVEVPLAPFRFIWAISAAFASIVMLIYLVESIILRKKGE